MFKNFAFKLAQVHNFCRYSGKYEVREGFKYKKVKNGPGTTQEGRRSEKMTKHEAYHFTYCSDCLYKVHFTVYSNCFYMDLHIKLTLNPFLSQLKIVKHFIYTLYLGKVPKTPPGRGVPLTWGEGNQIILHFEL